MKPHVISAKYPCKCAGCGKEIGQGARSVHVKSAPRGRRMFCPSVGCAPASLASQFAEILGEPSPASALPDKPVNGTQTSLPVGPTTPVGMEAPAPQGADGSNALSVLAEALTVHLDGKVGAKSAPLDEEAIRAIVADAISNADVRRTVVELPQVGDVDTTGEHKMFDQLLSELALRHRVLICGPAGSGKTTAVERVVDAMGWNRDALYLMPAKMIAAEYMGYTTSTGDYVPTDMYRWAKHEATEDQPAILLLDELDANHPKALCALSSALANGWIAFPNGERVRVSERTHLVVATANTWGYGAGSSDYVGASKLDARTVNRFPSRLDWQYDEKIEQKMCAARGGSPEALAKAIRIRRNIETAKIRIVWSPRDTVALSVRVASGVSFADAVSRSALASLDSDQRSRALQGVS